MAFPAAVSKFLVQTFMPQVRTAFASRVKALKWVKEQGLSITGKDFTKIWNRAATNEQALESLKRVRRDHTPREGSFTDTDMKLNRKYQVIAEVSYFDELSQSYEIRHVSYVTDNLRTKGEMEATLFDIADDSSDKYQAGRVETARLVEVRTNKQYG